LDANTTYFEGIQADRVVLNVVSRFADLGQSAHFIARSGQRMMGSDIGLETWQHPVIVLPVS
jgi:hypothetical protein